MPLYTIIADVFNEVDVQQHQASSPELAIMEAIKRFPHHDGNELVEEEFAIISAIMKGELLPTLLPCCANTWLWSDGCQFETPMRAYIVTTADA